MKTSDRLAQEYVLNIRDEIHNRTYKLKFPGTRTVLEVKSDVFTLIDIPVRNQHWIGWPPALKNDKTMLAQSGISHPEHDLTVGKMPVRDSKKVKPQKSTSTHDEHRLDTKFIVCYRFWWI